MKSIVKYETYLNYKKTQSKNIGWWDVGIGEIAFYEDKYFSLQEVGICAYYLAYVHIISYMNLNKYHVEAYRITFLFSLKLGVLYQIQFSRLSTIT